MKISVFLCALIFSVTSSQAATNCIKDYVDCFLPVINNAGKPYDCSLAVPFTKCLADVSKQCSPKEVTFLESYENITVAFCDPSNQEKLKKIQECIVKNATNLQKCGENLPENGCEALANFTKCSTSMMTDMCGELAGKFTKELMLPLSQFAEGCLEGMMIQQCMLNMTNDKVLRECKLKEEFNTIGKMCSSVTEYTKCVALKANESCSEAANDLLQPYAESLEFVMYICEKVGVISGQTVSTCDQGLLKCNVKLLNVDDLKCTDAQSYVDCMASAVKICEDEEKPLYLFVLEKYKSKFPEYCDENSAFNKNFRENYVCMNSTAGSVFGLCYEKLEKDKKEVKNEDKVGTLRAYVNFLHCVSTEFGVKCSKEAESAVNDLLNPLGESMDDTCRLLTGERCNKATGLIVGTWLLIASLLFLLTQRNE